MKTFRFLGLMLTFCFKIERVKRIEIPIPDYADDAGYSSDDKAITYWSKGTKHTINIPMHKRAKEIFVTPLYNKERTHYATNRKVILDLF